MQSLNCGAVSGMKGCRASAVMLRMDYGKPSTLHLSRWTNVHCISLDQNKWAESARPAAVSVDDCVSLRMRFQAAMELNPCPALLRLLWGNSYEKICPLQFAFMTALLQRNKQCHWWRESQAVFEWAKQSGLSWRIKVCYDPGPANLFSYWCFAIWGHKEVISHIMPNDLEKPMIAFSLWALANMGQD